MKPITISFKKTTRDTKLYLAVVAQEEKSDFVKDAIEFYLKHLESQKSN